MVLMNLSDWLTDGPFMLYGNCELPWPYPLDSKFGEGRTLSDLLPESAKDRVKEKPAQTSQEGRDLRPGTEY